MQLFVDLDGVLADFDAGYKQAFGVAPDKVKDNVDWEATRKIPNFYQNLPPMSDMYELWRVINPFNPIVLTGVPSSVPEAPANKKAWVAKHLGKTVRVICCRSSEKCLYAKRGDILIDDWNKYQKLWVARGGVWITHINAVDTIKHLHKILK